MAERVLVTGATGAQGGAVARALRDTSAEVVALVRDPGSAASRALAADGVTLLVGNLDEAGSIEAACAGCDFVFSVQVPGKPELRHARNLIDAAKKAGVAVTATSHSVDEVVAIVGEWYRPFTITQAWYTEVGYPARRAHAEPHGLPLATFEEWANDHAAELRESVAPAA